MTGVSFAGPGNGRLPDESVDTSVYVQILRRLPNVGAPLDDSLRRTEATGEALPAPLDRSCVDHWNAFS